MQLIRLMAAALAFLAAGHMSFAAELYFPPDDGAWAHIDPQVAGWNAPLLNAAIDVAGERNSSGVVMLYRGRILAERYWDVPDNPTYKNMFTAYDDTGRAIEDVASAQKSVVAVLTGIAQERGLLSLDDPVSDYLGKGWSKTAPAQEVQITIRHLLSMTSGLSTRFGFAASPGTRWHYNTPVYHSLMGFLMAASGLQRDEITADWVTEPLGMRNTAWTPRPWANAAIAIGLSTTARDLARFGLMIQAGGKWKDKTVVGDSQFLKDMLSPSQSLNPAYGFLWWLNGQDFSLRPGLKPQRIDGPMIAAAPGDLVAMQGAGDRKLYLIPSMDLVISRLGFTGRTNDKSFNDAFWEALSDAAPSPQR